jgi:hypothetical protein
MNTPLIRRRTVALCICAVLAVALSCSKKKTEENEQRADEAAPVDADAPAIVVAMIEAHGGMAAWRSATSVSFEDEFMTPDSAAVKSRVMVDQDRRRVYIDFPGTDQSMAWDGRRAWSMNWQQPYPPRFLALLNYYFTNLPWLTLDPGVRLSVAGKDSLWIDKTEYHIVNMSFAPGTGDTPRDTYRLYIDPASKRLRACAYTITYRALVPDSVDAMPENILVYDEFTKADGLLVPASYTIYSSLHQPLAMCRIRDWAFNRPFDEKRMAMPDSAVIDETVP